MKLRTACLVNSPIPYYSLELTDPNSVYTDKKAGLLLSCQSAGYALVLQLSVLISAW